MKCKGIVAVLLLGAVLLGATSSGARAQDATSALDAQAYQMYQQVLSPFCPGRSLNDCPSSKAHELKLEMRQKLEQGAAPETIIEDVFAKFGEQYRAVPSYAGFGKLVWWVPGGFLLAGVAIIAVLARGKRRNAPEKATQSDATLSDEMRRAIERELESLDGAD
jgi:cytochrome c-type biogenesis protein CcmH